jgi:hypothetical protein
METPNKRAKKASASAYSIFWTFNDADTPCLCCNPFEAIEHNQWTCYASGRSWFIVDEPTETWGDEAEAYYAEAEALMTSAEKAERLRKETAEAAERGLTLEASRMFNYAESQKLLNMRGKGRERHIGKVDEPCKFLYDCQGTPARPTTARVTTECWSHEYTHPETGKVVAKHVCDRLHPGEEGWCEQWNTDRNWKPSAAPTRTWDEGRFATRGHAARDSNRRR